MVFDAAGQTNFSDSEDALVKRLLETGLKIPAQPRVLLEFQECVLRGDTNTRMLARILASDPGVSAMLFKLVQSAVYRRYQPFSSIEHILRAIGIKQTCNLVHAIALASVLPSTDNQMAFEAFWARSQAIALLAMQIADERISVCNIFPDQAFLAGIFHDCGVPVLMQRFPEYRKLMRLDEPGRWIEPSLENAHFSMDHCVIGYLVGRHWRLPDFICDAIRFHHDIDSLDNHAARTMAAILQMATQIHYLDLRLENPDWASVRAEVLGELCIAESALPEFTDVVLDRFHCST